MEMVIRLEDEMLRNDPIPEPNTYMAAVQHRNMIRAQAEEIILWKIVHKPR